ncbi:type VI secretion protein ImpB [Bifidobacterium sp.]|jgi:DNA polymerase V|uniref:Y-family DNA polymerase n=1 Tax=Bifidobacterium sp. TaxID=41200 RepID=UPI0025B9A8F9|nr:type VI secretion protein ImpB [Bifidobacterium sp.]MCH4208740.1 type VI secretion protein ImpB [Bifidobacterium sp.]MCI1224000.1 type VI secretion protein ImpB [Bifidobacterium sp.]
MEHHAEARTYIAIDLKSFYASVECVERNLDPLTTNLVVADVSRTEKTICLAISPSLKVYGLPGRARLFEVVRKMAEINERRRLDAPDRRLEGESFDAGELNASPNLRATYIAAKPKMARYLQRSAEVYAIYLRYVGAQDIHVYSVDEVFMDVTHYLKSSGMSAHEMAVAMVHDVQKNTGLTATAGIGTNMYLSKVAMDIVAKHIPGDKDGVRVAELDEMSYRRLLWAHRPLTDFWRVGRGYAKKLESHGLLTMGDVARCSAGRPCDYYNEDLLYRMFGINAELLIDHAWGYEPCSIAEIKAYRPAATSMSSGQVLQTPYDWKHARLVIKEMIDMLVLEMVDKQMQTDQIGLYIGYERLDDTAPSARQTSAGQAAREGRAAGTAAVGSDTAGSGGTGSDTDIAGFESIDVGAVVRKPSLRAVVHDHFGRTVPKPSRGSTRLGSYTSSSKVILDAMMALYDRVTDPDLLVRRMNVVVGRLRPEQAVIGERRYEQPDLFSCSDAEAAACRAAGQERRNELEVQRAMLGVKRRFGRNAIVKGMDLEKGATGIKRNAQIGGHAA